MTCGPGWSERGGVLIGGARVSAGEEAGWRTNSGLSRDGPWASSGAGPNGFPSALFSFFQFSFPFLYSEI
jgi:hypothetical protein